MFYQIAYSSLSVTNLSFKHATLQDSCVTVIVSAIIYLFIYLFI